MLHPYQPRAMTSMQAELDEKTWFPEGLKALQGELGDDWSINAPGALPPCDYVVYAIATRSNEAIPRANGRHSRLLYVGMGQISRPQLLRQGLHSASHALNQYRRSRGGNNLTVELWVCPADNCALQEVMVLNACAREYGELPPANRKWEGYLSGEVLREMARWSLAEESPSRGRVSVYEWPEASPTSVWADVMNGTEWRFSLGWFFTPALLTGRVPPVPHLTGRLLLVAGRGAGNELADYPDFKSWGAGGALSTIPAPELDGFSAPNLLHAWLERYTNRGWRHVPHDAFETLRRTLVGDQP